MVRNLITVMSDNKSNASGRKRNWVFTLNNPRREELQAIQQLGGLRMLVYQHERGESGTPHIQGYVEWKHPCDIRGCKRRLGERVHCEVRRGSRAQAIEYCEKEDTREDGTARCYLPSREEVERLRGNSRGQRTDISSFKDAILDGKSTEDLINEFPKSYFRYWKVVEKIKALKRPAPNPGKEVILHYGAPGTGKTKWVYDNWNSFWTPMVGQYKWFDGYEGHDHVLFDDFAGKRSGARLADWLQLLDVYPQRVEVKSTSTWFHPKKIIITSNFKPAEWWDYSSRMVHYAALCRRITLVREFTGNGEFVEYRGGDLKEWLKMLYPIFIDNR
jgi:hypothetical protein